MPRTPIPTGLVHEPTQVAQDAELFEHLIKLTMASAQKKVWQALINETTTQAAAEWVADAQALLTGVVKPKVLAAHDVAAFATALSNGLAQSVPRADSEELFQHTAEFSRALLTGWIEVLHDRKKERDLDFAHLLPIGSDDEAGGWAKLWESVAAFAPDRADAFEVLRDVCEKLSAGSKEVVPLPMGLQVTRSQLKEALSVSNPEALHQFMKTRLPDFVRALADGTAIPVEITPSENTAVAYNVLSSSVDAAIADVYKDIAGITAVYKDISVVAQQRCAYVFITGAGIKKPRPKPKLVKDLFNLDVKLDLASFHPALPKYKE